MSGDGDLPAAGSGAPITAVGPGAGLAWLLWLGWMVFLVFPLMASWAAPTAWQRLLGIAITVAFAAVYVWLLRASFARDTSAPSRAEMLLTPGLALVAVAAVPAIGIEAMSFLPFLAAIGAFTLPRPLAWWWVGAVVALGVAAPLLPGADAGFLFLSIVTVAVAAGTVGGRAMQDRGEALSLVRDELVVTAERDRVARDVHDVLGHSLTVVTVKAALARRLLREDPDRAEAELAHIEELARRALVEVRSTVGGLRATRIDEELRTAERALASAAVEVGVQGDWRELQPQHRAVAAWVVREAVTNVVRHAEASACRIDFGPDRVAVVDDGNGSRARPGGGLSGMRDRVESSGGTLLVQAEPERGTRVEAAW